MIRTLRHTGFRTMRLQTEHLDLVNARGMCIRLFIEGVLSSEGHTVRTAPDGLLGLEEAMRRRPDIILTDLMMPRMTGLELMKAVKEHDPSIEAILMTAHSTVESAVGALRSGAYDFLTKPCNLDELEAEKREIEHLIGEIEERAHCRQRSESGQFL